MKPTLEIETTLHDIGDENCDNGWCGSHGYPTKCDKCGERVKNEN